MTTLSTILDASTLLATSSKKSSSSSELPFLIIILVFAGVYFFFLRPRQQRAKAQNSKGKSFEVGDEVMSVGGIYGRVVGLNDESVDVEVAPDVVLTFLRRAVNPRPASAVPPNPDDEPIDDEPDDDDRGPYGGSGHEDDTSFGTSSGHFGDNEEVDMAEEPDDEPDGVDEGQEHTGGPGQQHDHGSADGSATGTPRTTGGPSSEDD